MGEDSISGNYVIIEHTNADGKAVSWTAYMHLSKTLVEDGAELSAGDQIGLSGDTGNAKGEPPHLHFEIRTGRFGPPIDPMPAFNKPVD